MNLENLFMKIFYVYFSTFYYKICSQGYYGDPYTSCRAECIQNTDCPSDRPVCLGETCVNPCNSNVCGINAKCEVRGSTPVCSCPRDMTGDPFVRCRPFEPG